jgi:prepilin-type N-terminal cleavage/methylation domain-containing protein
MKKTRCFNIPLQVNNGFTLVEISIVMIIIGLLIGGVFSGMKLIDNANVQKMVQDLKAIEAATLTFRDTYRALPGDIRNPATRIPNCTVAPCATTGDGNRIIGPTDHGGVSITNTMENFTFSHHLQAADLVQLDISNTLVMAYGSGRPSTGAGYGLRFGDSSPWGNGCMTRERTLAYLTFSGSDVTNDFNCGFAKQIDIKLDDGMPNTGKFNGTGFFFCATGGLAACDADYIVSGSGLVSYDMKGF